MPVFIPLYKLDVYLLSRQLSAIGWRIYSTLDWNTKKVIGEQFIRSVDSVGANIAEGYARFHYLDKIKFYYNSRGSLAEASDHWLELLKERGLIKDQEYHEFKVIAKNIQIKLNSFITATYKAKSSL